MVPYSHNYVISVGGDIDKLKNAPKNASSKAPPPSTAPRHYVIVVDELKMRVNEFIYMWVWSRRLVLFSRANQ